MQLELVFTAHPTMLYAPDGSVRATKLTVASEIDEIDAYVRRFRTYLQNHDVTNVTVASWAGGDRDGNPLLTPDITRNLMKKIDYDLDIRDNAGKIDDYGTKLGDAPFSAVEANNLYETVSVMRDGQRFVISDCDSFAQIDLVHRLGAHFGRAIQVVPLFETKESLEGSVGIVERCLNEGVFAGETFEVMLAYSDTAKTGGLIDSAFQLYYAQCRLHDLARRHGKKARFFHGIGGSPIRGGSSYADFFDRLPDESLDHVRLTVQGEKIFREFGDETKIAATIARIKEAATQRRGRRHDYTPELLAEAAKVSEVSREAYRNAITPVLLTTFVTRTHQARLADLNCGSRPAKRKAAVESIHDIRAITWVFGWSSIDFYLPWWLGLTPSFLEFIATRPFAPWKSVARIIRQGIESTRITPAVDASLMALFATVSRLFYDRPTDLPELVAEIGRKGFVG